MDYLKSDMGARNNGSSARLVLSSARLARVHLKLTRDLSFLKLRVSPITGVRVVSFRVRRLIAAEMLRDSKSSHRHSHLGRFCRLGFPVFPVIKLVPIMLVKCWISAYCNTKKLLLIAKNSKLLPKFQTFGQS